MNYGVVVHGLVSQGQYHLVWVSIGQYVSTYPDDGIFNKFSNQPTNQPTHPPTNEPGSRDAIASKNFLLPDAIKDVRILKGMI